MATKNSGRGMFDALTFRQTARLIDRLRKGAEALSWDDAASCETASEIYRVLNEDLHPSWMNKLRESTR